MSYTFLTARYANAEQTAAIAETEEAASVALSAVDTPEDWAALMASGIPIAPYEQPDPTLEDYRSAIQAHVDATAQARNYDSAVSCASYVASGNPVWAAEAQAFVAWRDAVWAYAFAELDKVQSGQREQPTVADFVDEVQAVLPMEWPE